MESINRWMTYIGQCHPGSVNDDSYCLTCHYGGSTEHMFMYVLVPHLDLKQAREQMEYCRGRDDYGPGTYLMQLWQLGNGECQELLQWRTTWMIE